MLFSLHLSFPGAFLAPSPPAQVRRLATSKPPTCPKAGSSAPSSSQSQVRGLVRTQAGSSYGPSSRPGGGGGGGGSGGQGKHRRPGGKQEAAAPAQAVDERGWWEKPEERSMQAYAVQPLDPWQEERLERAYAADGRRKMKVCAWRACNAPCMRSAQGQHTARLLAYLMLLYTLPGALDAPCAHVSVPPPLKFIPHAVVRQGDPCTLLLSIHSCSGPDNHLVSPCRLLHQSSVPPADHPFIRECQTIHNSPFIHHSLHSRAQVQALAEELGVDRVRVLGWAKEFAQKPAG